MKEKKSEEGGGKGIRVRRELISVGKCIYRNKERNKKNWIIKAINGENEWKKINIVKKGACVFVCVFIFVPINWNICDFSRITSSIYLFFHFVKLWISCGLVQYTVNDFPFRMYPFSFYGNGRTSHYFVFHLFFLSFLLIHSLITLLTNVYPPISLSSLPLF